MIDDADREVERILAMTEEELRADIAARGLDWDTEVCQCKSVFELAVADAAFEAALRHSDSETPGGPLIRSIPFRNPINGRKEPAMREIHDHKVNPANDVIKITVMDEPGAGGANHHYMVTLPHWSRAPDGSDGVGVWDIQFQNGPIAEAGVNGLTHEVLLAIVADRLRSFQAGKFSCRENMLALTKIEEAQHWLHARTLARMQRGVEGFSKE